ncbi:MAG: DUF2062 domain-containing protein [Desulfobacterales bacterium]|nr:DUF2062 domain-containing protein [Desulfobacterales bacterium]
MIINFKKRFLSALEESKHRILKIRGNPKEIALGFGLGLFVGYTPTMGFQMAIAVFFATLFNWNKISAAAAVWITNPLTAPFLYWINYVVGAKLLGMTQSVSIKNLGTLPGLLELIKTAPDIFLALTVGGVVIGLPLAILGYYLSLSAILKYRAQIQALKIKH